jgi:hypothetical protein
MRARTHKFPIARISEAFETALNRQKTKAIKIQLEFKQTNEEPWERIKMK